MVALAWVTVAGGARAGEINGRYVAAVSAVTAGATPAPEAYGGTVDIAPKRRGVAVAWHPADGSRRRRGLGLRDGPDVLGVSLATGGSAYGVQVLRRAENGREWRGPWITSIDGASGVGEIRFGTDGPLVGRHAVSCQRPGAGTFEGSVEIAERGPGDYTLAFYSGRTLLYRGLGTLLGADRLVVGWSFGSTPALAVYRLGADGVLAGRRLNWRDAPGAAVGERFAREGSPAAGGFPAAGGGGALAAGGGADDLPQPAFGALTEAESKLLGMMEPGAPSVQAWDYDELQRRYGAEGWADRWLAEQLAPDDLRTLRAAVKRRDRARTRAAKTGQPSPPGEQHTVGDLIAAERQRAQANDDD